MVAFAPDGSIRGARASAHSGFNGTAPWWEQAADDWAPYGGVAYRASGSHALGFRRDDLDLAGDGWNGDLATVEPGAVPPGRGGSGRTARPRVRSRGRPALGEGRVAQSRHAAHERRRCGSQPHGRGGAHLGEGVRAGRLVRRPARTGWC